jgi:carboxymethylenebutenolidase
MADVTIRAADGGSFSAYLATPKSGKGPGILVIQEIFGVNKVMRETADAFAANGYVALCPDLFWRQEPGVQITDKSEAEWKKAFALMQGFDQAKGVEDMKATVAALRKHQTCTGKVGSVGYCLGGKLNYLMCCRDTQAECAVAYYGTYIEHNIREAKRLSRPFMLHMAMKDRWVQAEVNELLERRLGPLPDVTIHKYPEADHAFARHGGRAYRKPEADRALALSVDFFRKHLG